MRFMNSRSCEVISSAPSYAFRKPSSQMSDSRSRWFDGSSSSMRVGPHQQDARQRDAHLPAARERADVAVHHLLREAEAGQDLARPRLERVAAELVEARLHVAEALEQRVHLVGARRIGQRVLQLLELGGDLGRPAPAPAITSATTRRPAISPTSWLK